LFAKVGKHFIQLVSR